MKISPRVLVAGIGNVSLGDDGFGVEVSRRLQQRALPDGVQVVDYGVRGFDLLYNLCDGWDAAIVVDATGRGGTPGTLYVIEPDADADLERQMPPAHGMHPTKVLAHVRAIGGRVGHLRLVGCEPAHFGGTVGLSQPVEAAIEPAVALIESLVAELYRSVA
jgi:hydrogenase maturation protease